MSEYFKNFGDSAPNSNLVHISVGTKEDLYRDYVYDNEILSFLVSYSLKSKKNCCKIGDDFVNLSGLRSNLISQVPCFYGNQVPAKNQVHLIVK